MTQHMLAAPHLVCFSSSRASLGSIVRDTMTAVMTVAPSVSIICPITLPRAIADICSPPAHKRKGTSYTRHSNWCSSPNCTCHHSLEAPALHWQTPSCPRPPPSAEHNNSFKALLHTGHPLARGPTCRTGDHRHERKEQPHHEVLHQAETPFQHQEMSLPSCP